MSPRPAAPKGARTAVRGTEVFPANPRPAAPKGAGDPLQRPHPLRRLSGLAAIAGLHVLGFWWLASTSGRDALKVAQAPVQARIIQELAPPPPPPPPPLPRKEIVRQPQPRAPAPPLHVSPPEVVVPAVPAQAIVASTAPAAPPAPAEAPAPVAAPAPPAAPAVASAGVVCPNSTRVRASIEYPPAALRRGITGDVMVEFVVTASGAIENVRALEGASSILAAAALEATRRFDCQGQGRAVRVQVPYSFRLQ
jgi:protein TonB